MKENDISHKRLAIVIAGGSLHNKKGLHNAAINRTKALLEIASYKVDVYFLVEEFREFHWYNLFHTGGLYRNAEVDGLQVRMLWKIEYCAKRYYRRLLEWHYDRTGGHILDAAWLGKYAGVFKDYDLLSVHTDDGAILAHYVYQKYKIPFCVTWHGSDIHTRPYEKECRNKYPLVIKALEEAYMNFFVSRALMEASDRLTTNAHKMVLYNGVSQSFIRYDEAARQDLRRKFGVKSGKVVAFAGNLVTVKNADLLPDIFAAIKRMYGQDIDFWIIGDGSLRGKIENGMQANHVDCKFWGNQPPESMPDFYNCIDVLLLPSKNEGLPLVTVEALACGANVVGSNAGGIPEVTGKDNCFDLDDNFIFNLSSRSVQMLSGLIAQHLSDCFTWTASASKENEIYNFLFN